MKFIPTIFGIAAIIVGMVMSTPAVAIINGTPATETQLPGHPAVALVHNRPGSHQDNLMCGATQVGRREVLTAAHCVADTAGQPLHANSEMLIVAGENTLNAPTTVEAHITNIIIHPDYDETIHHDLAVIKVDRDLPGEPVQLANTRTQLTNPIVAGYGAIAKMGEERILPDELQTASVSLVSNEVCRSAWHGLAGYDTQLCTKGTDGIADSCDGDSGSGLFTVEADQLILAGVVSFGSERCGDGTPAVYGSVAAHNLWLNKVLHPYVMRDL